MKITIDYLDTTYSIELEDSVRPDEFIETISQLAVKIGYCEEHIRDSLIKSGQIRM